MCLEGSIDPCADYTKNGWTCPTAAGPWSVAVGANKRDDVVRRAPAFLLLVFRCVSSRFLLRRISLGPDAPGMQRSGNPGKEVQTNFTELTGCRNTDDATNATSRCGNLIPGRHSWCKADSDQRYDLSPWRHGPSTPGPTLFVPPRAHTCNCMSVA